MPAKMIDILERRTGHAEKDIVTLNKRVKTIMRQERGLQHVNWPVMINMTSISPIMFALEYEFV